MSVRPHDIDLFFAVVMHCLNTHSLDVHGFVFVSAKPPLAFVYDLLHFPKT